MVPELEFLGAFISIGIGVKIPLEIGIRQLIAWLKLAIILMILLNRIIRQVNKPIRQILHIELFARRPNIPILVPIALHASIN